MQTWSEQLSRTPGAVERAKGHLLEPRSFRLPIRFAAPGNPAVLPIHFPPSRSQRPSRTLARGRQVFRIYFQIRLLHYRGVRWTFLLFLIGGALAARVADAQVTNASVAAATNSPSRVIEIAGRVEYTHGGTNWQDAVAGLALQPGDRVRTREQSRAAVQLSDRSVIRLSERTTLEILPPRRSEKKRFGLPRGALFFFNRENPADVEFDTPLAAGAIRGTEFLLEVAEADSALRLALIDGLVALQTSEGEVGLERGQELKLNPGQAAQKTALVNAASAIQWALYYPAVLDPDDLRLTAGEQKALAAVVRQYRAGDLLAALNAWPAGAALTGEGTIGLRAQLELTVGRVTEAERLLGQLPAEVPARLALAELIAVVRGSETERRSPDRQVAATGSGRLGDRRSASEWLAHSYSLQARADLPAAREAARQAVALAPRLGFAHTRLAELDFSFGARRAALAGLDRALELSPRLAPAHALRGFVSLDQGDVRAAQKAFDAACELDAAFGPAWLGRGLCLLRERNFSEARAAFQAAAALEPQRGLFRSYLGKAASEIGDAKSAEKEFNLAKRLDANDPTAWLYSALHLWQQNRLNEAVRDLEKSADLNDQRAPFRSRLLLDSDRAVRSANLAALYEDVGVPEASRRAASSAVSDRYADFSGHWFLANSYQAQSGNNRFDLRLETARQSELLVANLLAPPGAGNLSQLLSQQEHLRFFDPRPVGLSSLTEYGSDGDWRQAATVFGTIGGFSYAFDSIYESFNGQQPNGASENRQFILTLKQRVTPDDEAYFQIGQLEYGAGDVANHYNPADAKVGFRVTEKQEPTLYAGWHHTWSPGSHTLLLAARLTDRLTLRDPLPNVPFLVQSGGVTDEIQSPQPFFLPLTLTSTNDFTLYSLELQQVWETPQHSLILGGRWQTGEARMQGRLDPLFPGPLATDFNEQSGSGDFDRANVYAYYTWRICAALRVIGGMSYDHLSFPANMDLPPISTVETSRDNVSPKAGLLFAPWERGLLRASYAQSLGGLYFDNSVRLEPTQLGGFNQAFRSLIPESVAGLVPGTKFETTGIGFDQSFATGTWLGIEAEWLTSDGTRSIGVVTNSTFLPFADSPGQTRETLAFRERNLSAYAGQLLGENFSLGARYRVSEATLKTLFPDIPTTAANFATFQQRRQATLQELSLTANFHHRCGAFAQWESAWSRQGNAGDPTVAASADFWQHNFVAGYRFPRRAAEIRLGLLNIFDADYRLNPLNIHAELPRGRTLTVSLRLNF
jgi:Flp pilus assembly protein TadD